MILGLAEPCQDNYELHSKNSQPYLFILGLATNLPIHLWKTLPYLLYEPWDSLAPVKASHH